MNRILSLTAILAAIIVAAFASSCHSVDDDRIPYCEVRLIFSTEHDWTLYGVKGAAADYAYYIYFPPTEKYPSDFPYKGLDRTGFGGLLLVTDINSNLSAYDLACPVEVRRDVRVEVDQDELLARCPRCGSCYNIFENRGNPISGPAADKGYALQRYHVSSGGALEYKIVTR